MKRNIININKRQGDTLKVSELNNILLKEYSHINSLIPDDVSIITTKQFEHTDTELDIPNYCGTMSSTTTSYNMHLGDYQYNLIDSIIEKLIREINNTLDKI